MKLILCIVMVTLYTTVNCGKELLKDESDLSQKKTGECLDKYKKIVKCNKQTNSKQTGSKQTDSMSCLDGKGTFVDWFIVYKAPKQSSSVLAVFRNGVAFYYMDINKKTFTLQTKGINETNTPIEKTLNQIYSLQDEMQDENKNFGYAMYNDQPPNGTAGDSNGHVKGVMAFKADTGFWLLHSVPQFPSRKSIGYYSWPGNAESNGQIMMCISVTTTTLLNAARELQLSNPYMYDTFNLQPEIQSFISTILSINSNKFTSFAKFKNPAKDIYVDIANYFKNHIQVQSWLNGAGTKLNSSCNGKYKVEDILQINLTNHSHKSSTDHSKWAITPSTICVGSSNRMVSQTKRGGHALCLTDKDVWNSFKSIVANYSQC